METLRCIRARSVPAPSLIIRFSTDIAISIMPRFRAFQGHVFHEQKNIEKRGIRQVERLAKPAVSPFFSGECMYWPRVCISPFDAGKEAIVIANDREWGLLSGGIYTTDVSR
ncbi:hypothetical protein [Paraburkholderia sp. 40]|uniref:hypothetical protein n=1 Tax=Paraburkholderia sp. 40 TaxID=2991059 RepID=UPI003D1FAE9C